MKEIILETGTTYKLDTGLEQINIVIANNTIEINTINKNVSIKPQYSNQILLKLED